MVKELSKNKRIKELGAFYTPNVLADFLASTLLSFVGFEEHKVYSIVDPSTGDSALLEALARQINPKIECSYMGIDIEESAIQKSREKFSSVGRNANFLHTDALYPLGADTPIKGWATLFAKYLPNGIDLIVSNPPWGASKKMYNHLSDDFDTAKGQFDIYDLFVETSIKTLNKGGYYAIILPDSLYSQAHTELRKLILEETSPKAIIRIGEGFFQDVNIAVTLLFGVKEKKHKYNILCSHLSAEDRKATLAGKLSLSKAVKNNSTEVSASAMIKADYAFITDIKEEDAYLLRLLQKLPTVGDFVDSSRGVELSKKGYVLLCPDCGKWFAEPRKKDENFITCPHCHQQHDRKIYEQECIISQEQIGESVPFIAGEDVNRFTVSQKSFLRRGYCGINYKNESLYEGPKILVRKTGVGITAGIDYGNCWTNQVVYIMRRKSNIPTSITNEVILAILNSRVVTYFIIKKYGSNGWKTHAYLSQTMIAKIPFPQIKTEDKNVCKSLKRITEIIRGSMSQNKTLSPQSEAELERIVAGLFHVEEEQYNIIFKSIEGVQQMIPFKRLLNINKKQIFHHGI